MSTTNAITIALLIHILLTTLAIILYTHLRNLDRTGRLQTLLSGSEQHIWTSGMRLFWLGVAWIRRHRRRRPRLSSSSSSDCPDITTTTTTSTRSQQQQQQQSDLVGAVTGIEPVTLSGLARDTIAVGDEMV